MSKCTTSHFEESAILIGRRNDDPVSGEVLPVVGADHANGVTVLGNSGVEQVELVLYFLNTAILYTKRFVTALS